MKESIDDSVKQKLLDLLAEEPTMVLSTAYIYAKNYVEYGEDITKAWTTAVQQASVIQGVRQKAWAEAYDSFNKDYETHLKADMYDKDTVAWMFRELQLEIEKHTMTSGVTNQGTWNECIACCSSIVQQKIDALKEYKHG